MTRVPEWGTRCCRCQHCNAQQAGVRVNPALFATIVVRGFTNGEYAVLTAATDAGMLGEVGDD